MKRRIRPSDAGKPFGRGAKIQNRAAKGSPVLLCLTLLLMSLLVLTACGGKNAEYGENRETISEGTQTQQTTDDLQEVLTDYTFRTEDLLQSHYEKHGRDMGFESPEEYCLAANVVISHPDSLHKIEKEDGDDVYYLEEYNAFVILSKDGYIRTFFYPDSGKKYYDKQ